MKLELVNQQEYFDRYTNNLFITNNYIMSFMNVLRDKIYLKAIKKLFKNKYSYINNISTSNIIFIFSALEIDELETLFGKGFETEEFGEGFHEKKHKIKVNKKTNGICYFFKLNGIECIYFIDHRGTSLEHCHILENDILQFYIDLTELIITKTGVVERYKEYLKYEY